MRKLLPGIFSDLGFRQTVTGFCVKKIIQQNQMCMFRHYYVMLEVKLPSDSDFALTMINGTISNKFKIKIFKSSLTKDKSDQKIKASKVLTFNFLYQPRNVTEEEQEGKIEQIINSSKNLQLNPY
ncbi:hypothetical protein Glove_37g107 [Diversispora epigaea]|uniref:Uncharacterized protein n=1 Tax=Diversispora epigaea TaxID=1348612 RepID=A0A397JG99_9GLOM|nr:hypothetical protein Glove_37g107 [Diversispora epigaea]